MWNMFKVNKNQSGVSGEVVFLLFILTQSFALFSSVFHADFKQVIISWVLGLFLRSVENCYRGSRVCRIFQIFLLTHFLPMFPFCTPWKHHWIKGFLVFSGGIKWKLVRNGLKLSLNPNCNNFGNKKRYVKIYFPLSFLKHGQNKRRSI